MKPGPTTPVLAALFYALAAAVPTPLAAQTAAVDSLLAPAGWLSGCWTQRSDGTVTDEQWMTPAGDAMVGMSRTVREGRTVGFELLRIVSREGALVYVADPSGQERTEFSATHAGADSLVFENPAHDFPTRIAYRRATADSVTVEVSGGGRGFRVRYARAPCPGG